MSAMPAAIQRARMGYLAQMAQRQRQPIPSDYGMRGQMSDQMQPSVDLEYSGQSGYTTGQPVGQPSGGRGNYRVPPAQQIQTGGGGQSGSPGPSGTPLNNSGYPTMQAGWNSGGGYFTGGAQQPPSPGTGGLQFPSPRSPYYNQNMGPSLVGASGPGLNPNSNYGQNWQNYSNPSDMMYNQYIGAQFGPQQQALWDQTGKNINQFGQKYQQYTDIADAMYGYDDFNKNAYYRPDEIENMTRSGQFQSGMTTPEEFASTYFSPEEQAAISGDPYAGSNYFNQKMSRAYDDQDTQENRTFDTLGKSEAALSQLGDEYGQYGSGALSEGQNAVRGAAYNPDLKAQTGTLSLSDAFQKDYNFGDKDMADLENLAGTTAGKQIQSQYDAIDRRAAAEGNTSPMALAAAKQRFANDAAAQASDAATGARVQGRGLQLSTMANKEGMRVGAEQQKENIRGQAAQSAAGLQTGAEQNLLANKLGFGQSLAGFKAGNEQFGSGQRLGAYSNLGAQRQGLNQFTAGTGGQFAAQADTNASNRAGNIASQRTQQQTQNNAARYGQNFDTQKQLAAAGGKVADQRLAAGQEQRGYFTGQAAGNQAALQNATNAGTNYWTNWNNAGQTAANSYGTYDLGRRNQQLQQQVAMWNRQYQGVPGTSVNLNTGGGN